LINIISLLIIYLLPILIVCLLLSIVAIILSFSENLFKKDMKRYFLRLGKNNNIWNIFIAIAGDNGIQGIFYYRLSSFLARINLSFLANVVRRINMFLTGMDISPFAQIGPGLEIYHGHGLVIGREVKLGTNILVCQGVTIGNSNSFSGPVIGDNTKIFAGAKVLGKIVVGDNCIIGANVVLTQDIPSNSKVLSSKPIIITKK